MTSYEIIPVPADLGQALAFPGIYLEAPAGLPPAPRTPRVRRPGRMRRKVATVAAVVAAAAISLAGCSAGTQAQRSAPEGCHTPAAPNGTTISVDRNGNASSPATGGLEFRCAGGKWVRMTARHDVIQAGGVK